MEGSLDTGLWLDAENYQISIGLAVSTRSEGGDAHRANPLLIA